MRPREIIIALSAHRPEFPLDGLPLIPDARFASIFDGNDRARFIHAKALLIQTEHWDHLVYGSANCSDDALGLADKAARNAECSIYRRLKAGTGLGALGLDISVPIDRKDLYPQAKQLTDTKSDAGIPPGTLEAAGNTIRWTPSNRITEPEGATLVIAEGEFPFHPTRSRGRSVELPSKPRPPLIARVRLAERLAKLSEVEQTRETRRVPLLVWANFGLPHSEPTLSVNMIAPFVLERMGIARTGLFAVTDSLRRSVPVVSACIESVDGQLWPRDDVPPALRGPIEDYRVMQYDLLLGERYGRR